MKRCNNGVCAGIIGSKECCFECSWYEECPADIKCDDQEGFKSGKCGGNEEC